MTNAPPKNSLDRKVLKMHCVHINFVTDNKEQLRKYYRNPSNASKVMERKGIRSFYHKILGVTLTLELFVTHRLGQIHKPVKYY